MSRSRGGIAYGLYADEQAYPGAQAVSLTIPSARTNLSNKIRTSVAVAWTASHLRVNLGLGVVAVC